MTSEVGWVTKNKLILTLNNDYYLINLKQKQLKRVNRDISYGKQQVNMNLYCSIVRKIEAGSLGKSKSAGCGAAENTSAQVKASNKVSY